ncbi:pseudouridine synthase-like protein [Massariosphaeria phaeospora]|uniref:tRNA pseudouridine(55) synthase n=1 Tax=Massariosphaeria phaeospora TaxID=100035 RepID=A0A7C8MHL9_9PLEO|nr:pseudouridine synthase-like protein [Massariosphaeria phaeospora]
MSSQSKESRKLIEGIFAINKPQWTSSAGVLRDLQTHFASTSLFQPWVENNRRHLIHSNAKKRHINNLKVKLGHGGTLDPLATGVLIVGVGRGTKCLQRFLECTKTYECVILFGAATDTYDAVGKVVSKAPYKHVTKELVEEKLAQFRGKIMQKPSVFSALKVDGKKMYEYAREGGDIPEVKAREVEVTELEMVEWLEPGTHEFSWPKEEFDSTEKAGAEKLMAIRPADADAQAKRNNKKRFRSPEDDDHVTNAGSHPKKPRNIHEPAMSGALPVDEKEPEDSDMKESSDTDEKMPPAARLRMTVTSGFYVRSLCHDLGLACNSLGLMSALVRSRQGDYELGKNVLEYTDLGQLDVWEPKVEQYLTEFMDKEGWEVEEVESEEAWQAKKKQRQDKRKEKDQGKSYQGNRNEVRNHHT